MSGTEYRVVTFTQPTSAFFGANVGEVNVQTVDFLNSAPQLGQMMDGWEPISFQLIPNGKLTYLSIMLKYTHEAPDSPESL